MNPMNSFISLCRPQIRWSIANLLARQHTSATESIVLPKRIQRGPTDILKALESTIQRDYTAPEYKYHDDPYLIPASNSAKRIYALSKESGRKAALWIRKEHAEWFDQKLADPPIKAFTAKPAITDASEASEDILKNLIDEVSVTDAITVYEILKKNEQAISDEVMLSFLELLCFHNCSDTVSEDLFEERWFRQSIHGKQKPQKTWRDGSLAETVFESLSSGPYGGNARRALVRGMARHGQAEKAWQILRDMTASNDPKMAPDTGCYNALISAIPYLKEGAEPRWQFTESLLMEMASRSLQPNLNTLNSILEVLSTMRLYRKTEELALRSLAEFHQLGIEPSLATYYYILSIFCKDRGPRSYVLIDILNKLDGKPIKPQDPRDTLFFVTAMEVCRHHLQDVDLAHRVHDLLLSHNNYDLIGDSYKESVYYRNYFILMCTMEPLETFMEVYNKLVPTAYVPEPVVMEEILKAIDLNGALEHLPRMWSDMIIFDQTRRDSLLSALLDIMARNPVPVEVTDKNEMMRESYMRIAWGVWEKIEEEDANIGIRVKTLMWTGSMLGDLLSVCVQCGEFQKAWQVLLRLGADEGMSVVKEDYEPPPVISGVPSINSLSLFVDACIKEGNTTRGIICVKYAADAGFPEAGDLGKRLSEGLKLNSVQMGQLTNAVGVLRTDPTPKKTDSVRKSIDEDYESSTPDALSTQPSAQLCMVYLPSDLTWLLQPYTNYNTYPEPTKGRGAANVRHPGPKVEGSWEALVDHARKSAALNLRLQKERRAQAQAASRSGIPSAAAYYCRMASLHKQKADEANRKAANILSQVFTGEYSNLKDSTTGNDVISQPPNTLDMHSMNVLEALHVLNAFLDAHAEWLRNRKSGVNAEITRRSNPVKMATLFLITGRGVNSQGGIPRIKPAVEKQLEKRGVWYEELNPGLLRVMVSANLPPAKNM